MMSIKLTLIKQKVKFNTNLVNFNKTKIRIQFNSKFIDQIFQNWDISTKAIRKNLKIIYDILCFGSKQVNFQIGL
jgi:hypothetical protein